jgi:hypothetical protein
VLNDIIIYMARRQRSSKVVTGIAQRFSVGVEEHFGLSVAQLSQRLGYANPSTVQAIKKGSALPDFARLSEYKEVFLDPRGRALNLHWVITGDGAALLCRADEVTISNPDFIDDIIILVKKLPLQKQIALVEFLRQFALDPSG